ncbi:DMT family transporter [Alsobacter sp. SYSU M60028]|uniref:DMT family transporter n=1 Tax=Alsobacter ponti TaxID=2962936 RepID=A0ABT1LGN7_9HYPH|nr:DMT family transporter [Alsobacter ponti]MCP8940043.1 DMT family transporter [Alsobacter ponti]
MSTETTPDNRRGIVAMLAAMAFFVANDAMTKLARETLGAGQVMAVRGVFALAITLALVAWMGEAGRLRLVLRPRVLGRATSELAVATLYIIALGFMPLADLIAVMQSTPLLIAVYLAFTGLEPMGWRRWLSILVGFAGVLLVVRPGGSSFDIYTVAAFGSAVLVGVRDLATRRFGSDIPTVLILFSSVVLVMAGGVAMASYEGWRPLSPSVAGVLAGAAFFVVLGNYAMITAFRNVEVAVVSPFRYSVIVWGALAGYLVFGEVPDLFAALGACLIVAAGVYTVHRERLRARAISASAATVTPETRRPQ